MPVPVEPEVDEPLLVPLLPLVDEPELVPLEPLLLPGAPTALLVFVSDELVPLL